jgi:GT2 family glycosyltransferase
LSGSPRLSILLVNYNGGVLLDRCLQSLRDEAPACAVETILVDNASTDGTKEFLSCLGGDVTVIANATNLGFAKACNQGIGMAKGEHILLLHNDAVVTEGWLEKLLSHLDGHPETGMVGPMSNGASGPQRVPEVPYGDDMEEMQEFAYDFSGGSAGGTNVILGLGGFCLLVRKEVTDIIGGLDEGYVDGRFLVDDFCMRSCIAGYRNVIAENVFVHHSGGTGPGNGGIGRQTALQEDLRRFADRWKGLVEIDGKGCRVSVAGEQQVGKLLEWGEARFARGDFMAAMKIFLRVLRFDGANSEALNNLGVIQWHLGDAVTAMRTFQSSLDINPGDTDALVNLARATADTGRIDLIKPDLLAALKKAQPASPDLAGLMLVVEGKQKIQPTERQEHGR